MIEIEFMSLHNGWKSDSYLTLATFGVRLSEGIYLSDMALIQHPNGKYNVRAVATKNPHSQRRVVYFENGSPILGAILKVALKHYERQLADGRRHFDLGRVA
ncbi:hypothetical protein [Rhizobium multihospitium]|uniref:Uncharacterized protein n=1 Tax=Rhizobium multihospitium TaxID=410764 RepID=A0A1C3WLB2_9HYPH|nr:hypothetical protein [Rhizobium multihospitium]SCB40759.1 hypothetical protein GA0061103_5692 [Rhizobium multihospitium]